MKTRTVRGGVNEKVQEKTRGTAKASNRAAKNGANGTAEEQTRGTVKEGTRAAKDTRTAMNTA